MLNQGINISVKREEITAQYPIILSAYLGALMLSHDAYSGLSAKSVERLTMLKDGSRINELTSIGLRKVNVKDSTSYKAGGVHIIIHGL